MRNKKFLCKRILNFLHDRKVGIIVPYFSLSRGIFCFKMPIISNRWSKAVIRPRSLIILQENFSWIILLRGIIVSPEMIINLRIQTRSQLCKKDAPHRFMVGRSDAMNWIIYNTFHGWQTRLEAGTSRLPLVQNTICICRRSLLGRGIETMSTRIVLKIYILSENLIYNTKVLIHQVR